jgi:hypothetical protein
LQANVQALPTHAAVAFPTLVEQALPQVPQSFELVVVSTHDPLQRVGVLPGQPETHPEFEQAGVLLSAAHTLPHPAQLLRSVVVSTQAPLQRVSPLLQVKVQPPLTHDGVALATAGQAWPQLPQLLASLVVLVHVPLHSVGTLDGQPEAHEYDPAEPAHTGAPASAEHDTPHAPQWAAVVYWTQAPAQEE